MNRPIISQQPRNDTLKQPVTCPWIANPPYPSPLANKNRTSGQRRNSSIQTNNSVNNHWETSQNGCTANDETYSSMQQSSNQFFLFLRLMQLFPHTHPATLHSVLYICKNDFFCAIDKLLYAKRCRLLYNNRKNQIQQQRATDKFTVINNIADVNAFKRTFSNSSSKSLTEDENDSDKEAKKMKMNEQDLRVEMQTVNVREVLKGNAVKICEKPSENNHGSTKRREWPLTVSNLVQYFIEYEIFITQQQNFFNPTRHSIIQEERSNLIFSSRPFSNR